MINFSLSAFLEPTLLAGTSVAMIFNTVAPSWLIQAIFTLVLVAITIRTTTFLNVQSLFSCKKTKTKTEDKKMDSSTIATEVKTEINQTEIIKEAKEEEKEQEVISISSEEQSDSSSTKTESSESDSCGKPSHGDSQINILAGNKYYSLFTIFPEIKEAISMKQEKNEEKHVGKEFVGEFMEKEVDTVYNDAEIEEMLKEAEIDADGKINFEEFVKMLLYH